MMPIAAVAGSFILSLMLFYYGLRFARRVRYVDRPGGRKQHVGGTPPIGGLVIVPVFILSSLAFAPGGLSLWPLYAGLLALLAAGVWDDRRGLNPWIKFFAQIAVALFIVLAGGADILSLGRLFGDETVWLGFLSVPFSVACLVLLMNALNMIDGLDGLAGGIAASILLWLMAVAGLAGQAGAVLQMAFLLAPLLAFLFFNLRHPWRRKAAVFLGDAGSLTLALALGWFCIHLSQTPAPVVWPVTVVWLLAVPVIDTLTLFFLRLMKGRHPFSPDRNHLHHRFLARGMSVPRAVWLMLLGTALGGGIGVGGMLMGVSETALLLFWAAALLVYAGFSLRPSAQRVFHDNEDL